MLEPLELSILAAIRRLTRNGEFTDGPEVGKDLEAVGMRIEDQRLYGLLMNLKEDGYIKATLVLSTSSNAFKLLQLTTHGREAARADVDPLEQVLTEARGAIGSERFEGAFPGAFQPWSDAEKLLWRSDAASQLTTIGHKVREAAQAFATAMIDSYGSDAGETHSVTLVEKRLGSVIAKHRKDLGEDRRKVLEGLGTLWNASNKLTQRQEHGAQKEGEDVTWDDARRIVYLTMFLMIEFVSMFEQISGVPVAVLEPQ